MLENSLKHQSFVDGEGSTAKKNPNFTETISIRGNSKSNSKKYDIARP